jgi:hypothetical protein
MSRARSTVIAATAAALLASGIATSVAVGPAAADGAGSALPGYTAVTDDTGTITMLVPDGYVIDTAPFDWNGDGLLDPRIKADADQYTGLEYVALPYDPDYLPWDGTCEPNMECAGLITSETYSDGMFTGFRQLIEGCCDSGYFESVDANADNGLFLAHVAYYYGNSRDAAEVAVFETALATFNLTGQALPNTPSEVPTAGGAVFPWVDFHDVPQLGTEPVRGTGCGGNGTVGDVIPDGIWSGFVSVSGGAVSIDLVCVYTPEAAPGILAAGTANIINNDPYYLVVNNNPRLRSVPAGAGLQLRDGMETADGACVEGDATSDHSTRSDRQAWVNIQGGVATWVFWACAPFGAGTVPPAPTPSAPLPPAYPDYSNGYGQVWPYGQFWNVPQIGSEPVRGSGCGSEGQIGGTIPDGLWAVFVDGYDDNAGGFWVDLLCIYQGQAAQAVLAQGNATIINNEPDYLVVNNNTQTRFVPDGLAAFVVGTTDPSGQCVEGDHLSPEQLDLVGANRTRQAWLRISGGVATWIFYGCQ